MIPTYLHFNENYKNNNEYYVVLDGSDLVSEYTKFWRNSQRSRSRVFLDGDTFCVQILLPKKSTWKAGNYTERKYKVVNVGYKDKTTHLTTGKIYQLEKID